MEDISGVSDAPERVEFATTSYAIPDFGADEAAIKSLEVKIEHLITISVQAGLQKVRAAYAAKRPQLVASAALFATLAREAAADVPEATTRFNASVNRDVTDRVKARAAPTILFEEVVTLGRAGRLHRAMLNAEVKSVELAKRARDARIALERYDGQLVQFLKTRETDWRRHFESADGRAELLRDERVAKLAAKVDAIHAERKAFERRLEAGLVSVDELRAREMAREKLAFLSGKVDGLYFNGHVAYGDLRYFRLRDRTGRDWLLDWDDELLELEKFEFNVVHLDDGSYRVERSNWSDRRTGIGRLHDPNRSLTGGVDLRLIAALREFALDLADPWR